VPEDAPGVAETLDGADGADVVALCVGGWVIGTAVALGLAERVAVRLGRLPIELVTVPPHPAARQPTTAMATSRESLFVERRMMIPPHCSWPSAEASAAGDREGVYSVPTAAEFRHPPEGDSFVVRCPSRGGQLAREICDPTVIRRTASGVLLFSDAFKRFQPPGPDCPDESLKVLLVLIKVVL
jgi:hypothetical protein